jgi:hypothetical protein
MASFLDYAIPGGQLAGGLAQLLGFGNENPAEAAQPYLEKIPGTIKPYYQPYINAGSSSIPTLQSQFKQLINNPQQLLSNFGQGYEKSPGYQFSVDQATKAANQAAAAGGMVGSPAEQQALAGQITGLANQDYYNYLNKVLGLYGQGLQGYEGLYQGGLTSSNALANLLAENLQNQAGLAYAGQANQNQANGSGWGNLFSGLAGVASNLF